MLTNPTGLYYNQTAEGMIATARYSKNPGVAQLVARVVWERA